MTDETATNLGAGDDESLDLGVADHTDGVDGDETELSTDQTDDGEDGAEGAAGEEVEPELEDVEHDGQTYKVPKALKPALMMQADYTRKTQELAQQRTAWEQERTQQAEAMQATVAERGELAAMDKRLGQFKEVDWGALAARDQATAMQLRMEYDQLKEARDELAGQIGQKEQETALEAQRAHAKRIQEGLEVLRRDIPGFSLELVGKLTDHAAKAFGFTPEEVSAIDDPRIIKALHRLYELDGKAKQAKQTETVQQRQKTQPARSLRGSGGQFAVAPDTSDFAAFERLATSKAKA